MTNPLESGLGRLVAPDERDEPFRIEVRLLPPRPVTRVSKHWPMFIRPLDQGQTGRCVGHGWRHWLQAAPVIQPVKYPTAVEIYDACTQVDEWPGNDNFDKNFGTSVRSGGKVLKTQGLVSEYNMTNDVYTMADWIGGKDADGKFIGGPLVAGTNWYLSMYDPDADGMIHISGSSIGGHCFCILGWNQKRGVFYCVNSWGSSWGKRGRFMMSAEDMHRLMTEDGEAWTAQEVRI